MIVRTLLNDAVSLELRRTVSAAPDAVYRAWTDPALLGRWMAPRPFRCEHMELDVRVGGRYRIGMFNPENGNRPSVGGVYEVVEVGKKLVFTWKWENSSLWQENSRVTVEITPVASGTEVRLIHDQLPNDAERENHVKGWTACFEQLEETF